MRAISLSKVSFKWLLQRLLLSLSKPDRIHYAYMQIFFRRPFVFTYFKPLCAQWEPQHVIQLDTSTSHRPPVAWVAWSLASQSTIPEVVGSNPISTRSFAAHNTLSMFHKKVNSYLANFPSKSLDILSKLRIAARKFFAFAGSTWIKQKRGTSLLFDDKWLG